MTSTRFHDNGATRPPRIIPVGEELPPMEAPPASSNGRRRQQDRDRNKPKGKTTSKAKVVGERFRILNAFLDFTASRLQRNELLVWLILYRDARDGIARTSQADLARRAGVSKRTVIRAVRKLVHRGLLAVAHRGSIRLGPSAYRLLPLERDGTERRDR